MSPTPEPATAPSPPPSRPRRGWMWLVLALAWVGAARVPLVLNARSHLDSDLAVDGLTLIDALDGHWRWHYPATPFIGSPPVLLSYVQARVFGPGPMALVSGGVVAYGLVVAATYALNRRAFGPSEAAWGLVPMAFASTGTVWLAGRVTGGHLLATAWHAWAFALLWGALTRGGWRRSAALGLWCGLGLYVDAMFAVTWAGLGVAALLSALDPAGVGMATPRKGGIARGLACLLAFGLASGVGLAPRIVGQRVDPHDAYVGQFRPVDRVDLVARNARLLALDCLPRLIAGHRLPGLQADPDPSRLAGGAAASSGPSRDRGIPWLGASAAGASLWLFARAMIALASGGPPSAEGPARRAIRRGLLASSLAVVAGFLVHPSITHPDNYRYLVFLLVPWSTGFGLMMARLASRGRGKVWAAGALSAAFGALMTVDSARWYDRLGWVDPVARPVRRAVDDPALGWLVDHPGVSAIVGDYWDVYRLSFLTGGRVKGVPFAEYPDRFPEIRRGLPGARSWVMLVGPNGVSPRYRARAMARGGREVGHAPGLSIVECPGGTIP